MNLKNYVYECRKFLLTFSYIALASGESSQVGDTAKYTLYFKTPMNIPWTSYMIVETPQGSDFTVPESPNCDTYIINGKRFSNSIRCAVVNNKLRISGMTQDIPVDFEVGITFLLKNPSRAGETSNFLLYIFRENTQVAYAWRTDIPGVLIQPGKFSAITLNKLLDVIISRGKIMDYRLRFLTKNTIPFGMLSIE
jgi:hypothetical protein